LVVPVIVVGFLALRSRMRAALAADGGSLPQGGQRGASL
jgi:hypothetical protein